ncbi:unnamed protein product [Acanthocheilonema viteae]|uniref:SHSP domain-containing protein n=1 Tax=Acanthocheilonema viteae TaxID=6277 RepID=A0A498SBY1_ACAVI|nr:unnamed protein product [Acanthocheilonema viteae]
MVWQTFTRSKNTNSANNLTSSASLPPASSFPSSPPPPPPPPPPLPPTSLSTSTSAPNVSATINRTQHKSSSNERAPPPRPPPRFHRPTPKSSSSSSSSSSSRSFSHNTDNTDSNTSGYGSLHNDLPFSMTPAGRFFTHFFDEAMQYFNYPMHDIVWSDEPPTTNSCHGNSINEKIIDNDEKFNIEINLSDFLAGELLVIYDEEGRELLVEGHQKERNDRHGSVERNFKRKFDIPTDVHEGSLAAYLTPSGLLTIRAFKKANKQPTRRIPIQEVLDVPETDKNAAKAPTSETTEQNTTSKTNITPSVPQKPNNASELKSLAFEKMSKGAEKFPKIQKPKKGKMEQLNLDEIQKPADESAMKREYLNIFC